MEEPEEAGSAVLAAAELALAVTEAVVVADPVAELAVSDETLLLSA